jgi:hypothetical protein
LIIGVAISLIQTLLFGILYDLMKTSTKIIMLVKKDTNGNKKYDAEDEIVAFMADLADKQPAKGIFSPQDKQMLKKLFDRDWKRVL